MRKNELTLAIKHPFGCWIYRCTSKHLKAFLSHPEFCLIGTSWIVTKRWSYVLMEQDSGGRIHPLSAVLHQWSNQEFSQSKVNKVLWKLLSQYLGTHGVMQWWICSAGPFIVSGLIFVIKHNSGMWRSQENGSLRSYPTTSGSELDSILEF